MGQVNQAMMSDDDLSDEEHAQKVQALALASARRAVQFLESGQATGCFILLTDSDRAIMWDINLTPDAHPIGDAANVLGEMSNRLRGVWYGLIADEGDGPGFLHAVEREDDD